VLLTGKGRNINSQPPRTPENCYKKSKYSVFFRTDYLRNVGNKNIQVHRDHIYTG